MSCLIQLLSLMQMNMSVIVRLTVISVTHFVNNCGVVTDIPHCLCTPVFEISPFKT